MVTTCHLILTCLMSCAMRILHLDIHGNKYPACKEKAPPPRKGGLMGGISENRMIGADVGNIRELDR